MNGRQAQLKFNTLLTRYQNTIDTEGSSTACPYYDVLHDVIGYGEQEVDTVNVEVAGSGAEVTEVTEMMDQDGVEVDSEGDESPEGPLEDSHRGSQELPGDEDGEEEAVVFDEELLQLIESNREGTQSVMTFLVKVTSSHLITIPSYFNCRALSSFCHLTKLT